MSALIGYLIIGALSFISRLPESLLVAIARAWGRVGPRIMRSRALMARKNLTRVYTYRDGVAPTRSALDRGIELLFEHHVRFYIETARAPQHARKIIATRVRLESEESVRAAFTRDSGGGIFLAAHFGAIELPGSILADRSGMKPVAPMEELGNPVPATLDVARTRRGSWASHYSRAGCCSGDVCRTRRGWHRWLGW